MNVLGDISMNENIKCLSVYMCVCMRVCVYIYIYIYIYRHVYVCCMSLCVFLCRGDDTKEAVQDIA